MSTAPSPTSTDPVVAALAEPAGSLLDSNSKPPPSANGASSASPSCCSSASSTSATTSPSISRGPAASVFPYILLGVALFIALSFEFVNGFHDTANAVATVIYTHSLEPHVAVVNSGILNLIGVLLSSGIVAFAIVILLLWSSS